MDIVRFSLKNPVTVTVIIILIVLFGFISLGRMPYQLSPTVIEPEITVRTTWAGATPYEIEREILEEQENVLKGLSGLVKMESTAYNNLAEISLSFKIGTDLDAALLRVSNKINEVRSAPDNSDKPVIDASGASASPIVWMILKTLPENERHIDSYRTFYENEVRQYIERVEGVSDLFVFGGTEQELHVTISPERLAAFGLTVDDLINVLRAENVNISAGILGVGRRDYRIRTVGEAKTPEDIAAIVINSTGEKRVRIGDIAEVSLGYEKHTAALIFNDEPGIVTGIRTEPGTNVLDVTNRAEAVVKELNETVLKENGIYLNWVYDQRDYINGAINLVQTNILIGALLAVCVLLVYLRSISSTIVVATAIPISVIGTFIFMYALGRNLNVVSLAGISFSVGMLVDSAIVVLENIDRHRKMGKTPYDAAYDGTKEVWGAVLASTLTTIAVFLPVVFIQEEAGQLFRDIAIAVTAAVSLSLFVSILVIPMLSEKFFNFAKKREEARGGEEPLIRKKFSKVSGRIVDFGTNMSYRIMILVDTAMATTKSRIITAATLVIMSAIIVVGLFPKMEYLPQGNRNMILNIFVPPPGLSYTERKEIGHNMYRDLKPFFDQDEVNGLPGIKNAFFIGADRIMLMGVISKHEQRAGELIPFFSGKINSIPGMFGISTQAGIFDQRIGGGRAIDVDISGNDMNAIIRAAGTMFGMLRGQIQGVQVRPVPSIELAYPEVQFIPNQDRLKALGMTTSSLGTAIDVIMDGRKVGDFKPEGQKKIDLVIKGEDNLVETPEDVYSSQIATPGGRIIPVSSVSDLFRTNGLTQIRHLERKRTVTLQVTPPSEMPLETAMDLINSQFIPGLQQQGMLEGLTVSMSGAADKLTQTRKALQWNFLLAAAITYLLMSALFGNFIYPFVVIFTVPMAAAGGFLGLAFVNLVMTNQPLDILTMLGFIILVGIVVNNAILIVHQTLNNIRYEGMEHIAAVKESVRTRLRPIFMSTTTSFFGMLPLVVAPGPGSELYRGLGSVVLGGIAMSTVFTVFLIPSLLVFFLKNETAYNEKEAIS